MKYFISACGILLAVGIFPLIAETPGFTIVVNVQNSVNSISKKEVSAIFLKRISKWDSGMKALPVDLKYDSPVRESFSKAILGKTVQSAKAYWQQQLFGGHDVPPPEKENENDVVNFVSKNPGAIGYVSNGARLCADVKILFIKNSD